MQKKEKRILMPSFVFHGEEIKEVDIFEMLPPAEGSINIFYGRIGSGKTAAGTRNILNSLKAGRIVYANWNVKWDGYDERSSKWKLFLGILGLKKIFYFFPKENFHFWDFVNNKIDGKPCLDFISQLSILTDCDIHLDEGHIPFDSYEATRMSEKKRSAVFAMRHFDRSLTVYTQRANSVHVNLRGNSNRFYKCEKIMDFKFFRKRIIRFLVTEFQDLTSQGTVDEERVLDKHGMPTAEYKYMVSEQTYWGTKKLFSAYESKYLRMGAPHSQENFAIPYFVSRSSAINNFFKVSPKVKLMDTPPLPPSRPK